MYICNCNPFNDKTVRKYLEKQNGKVTVAAAYRECSGGERPQCGTCLDTLKGMVREHNSKVTVDNLRDALPKDSAERKKLPSDSSGKNGEHA